MYIDLAIIDVVMPHCGGLPLAKSIRKLHSSIPIVFMTGYDREHVLGKSDQVKCSEVLTKPVDFNILSHKIRQLLD